MGRFTPPFSDHQSKYLALLPKFFTVPSIIGCLIIVQDVLRMRRRRTVYHRIILLRSLMDLIFSGVWWLSSWPVPRHTWNVWGAKGNIQTCTAAGFIGHGTLLGSACYTASLSVYFMTSIVYAWRDDKMRKKLEPWLHAIPNLVGWSTAVVGLVYELFNPLIFTCFIASDPYGCGPNTYPCKRGPNSDEMNIWRLNLMFVPIWTVFVVTGVCMTIILVSVKRREAMIADVHGFRGRPSQREKLTEKVAFQAFLYMLFFLASWGFLAVVALTDFIMGTGHVPVLALATVCTSLQGFFNALIYLRPRYLKHRREAQRATEDDNLNWRSALRSAFSAASQAISTNQHDYAETMDDDGLVEGSANDTNGELSLEEVSEGSGEDVTVTDDDISLDMSSGTVVFDSPVLPRLFSSETESRSEQPSEAEISHSEVAESNPAGVEESNPES